MEHHGSQHHQAHTEHSSKGHPSPRAYVTVGIVLAVLTALEVAAFELMGGFNPSLVVWIIMLLTAAKLWYVVGYFMHLKFDDWRFTALFVFPLIIMVSIAVVLMALFQTLTR